MRTEEEASVLGKQSLGEHLASDCAYVDDRRARLGIERRYGLQARESAKRSAEIVCRIPTIAETVW